MRPQAALLAFALFAGVAIPAAADPAWQRSFSLRGEHDAARVGSSDHRGWRPVPLFFGLRRAVNGGRADASLPAQTIDAPATVRPGALAAPPQNTAMIEQQGSLDRAAITQLGTGNRSGAFQFGKNDSAAISQNGSNDVAYTLQFGDNLSSETTQVGDGKTDIVVQGRPPTIPRDFHL